MAEFFGSEAGLSASTIQRLTREWSQELAAFQHRDLSQVDYVYLWADGVHFNIRLEEARLCCLVLLGVRADGHKELVAVGDGFRESTESWAEVLRDLKRRGRFRGADPLDKSIRRAGSSRNGRPSSESDGRKRPGLLVGGRVRARARSLRRKSAWR